MSGCISARTMHFAVIGSGVVGLTTALEIQKQFPNAEVTILADKFGVETTSDVAAGIFRPGSSFQGPTLDVTRRWIKEAYCYWDDISKSSAAELAGVAQLDCYMFSNTDAANVRNHYLEKLLPIYRACTEDELKLCPGDWKYGSFYSTILTECRIWMPWATKKFESAGGKVEQKLIGSLTEFDGRKHAAVFNCSGLGSRKLCNDMKMVPIRGQIIKVRAPWVKAAFYADLGTYIVPGFNGIITLGGTHQYESYNLNVDKYDSMSIRDRCNALLPSLKTAAVVREAVGLRPYRSNVRVESEILTDSEGNQLKCVHNYGHGGYGVTSSPGTAKYAVELAKQMLGRSGSKL